MRRAALLGLALAAAGPALGQGASRGCDEDVPWAGTGFGTSDLSLGMVAFDLRDEVAPGGRVAARFRLSAEGPVRIEAEALGEGDPYLTLLDATGAELGADDDGGGGLSARLEAVLPPGTYCAVVGGWDEAPMPVDLRISDPATPALTAGLGGVAGLAALLGGGAAPPADRPGPVVAAPGTSSPADLPADLPADGEAPFGAAGCAPGDARIGWGAVDRARLRDPGSGLAGTAPVTASPRYGFDLAEAAELTVTAEGLGDPYLRLFDADGALLAENDDADSLNSRIELLDPLPPGAYCLAVQDLQADNAVTVAMTLRDPAEARLRRVRAGETPPLPSDAIGAVELGELGGRLAAEVGAGAEAAWVSFAVAEGGLVTIEAAGAELDPAIALFDLQGRRLGRNDDGPVGLDSLMALRLGPGDYWLAVTLVGEGGAGPVRVTAERWLPAE
jgi:hypothetical protein